MIGMKNKRLKYLLLTLFVVMLGLLSRKMSACTLDFVKLYLVDVLWAMMVYFGCRFLFVNMRKRVACVLALVFSCGSFAGNHRGWLVGMEPEIKL